MPAPIVFRPQSGPLDSLLMNLFLGKIQHNYKMEVVDKQLQAEKLRVEEQRNYRENREATKKRSAKKDEGYTLVGEGKGGIYDPVARAYFTPPPEEPKEPPKPQKASTLKIGNKTYELYYKDGRAYRGKLLGNAPKSEEDFGKELGNLGKQQTSVTNELNAILKKNRIGSIDILAMSQMSPDERKAYLKDQTKSVLERLKGKDRFRAGRLYKKLTDITNKMVGLNPQRMPLTLDVAEEYMQQYGDKEKAKQAALNDGYIIPESPKSPKIQQSPWFKGEDLDPRRNVFRSIYPRWNETW